jgi:hypothetical protein
MILYHFSEGLDQAIMDELNAAILPEDSVDTQFRELSDGNQIVGKSWCVPDIQ